MTPERRAEAVYQSLAGVDQFCTRDVEAIAAAIREAVAEERLRWTTAGVCDPTAKSSREPDKRGLVHYLLSGAPEAVDTALRAIIRLSAKDC